jgi:tetratricopeptide (TPR) repeat protein
VQATPDDAEAHAELLAFASTVSSEIDPVLDFYRDLQGAPALQWWFSGQLHVVRGNKSYNNGGHARALFHYGAAKAAFRASRTIEKDYAQDARNMEMQALAYEGFAFLELGAFDEAEASFLRVLEEQGDHATARSGLDLLGGRLYSAYEAGDRKYFRRVTTVVTDRADWWNNLGFFARDTKEYETAYEAYSRAVDLEPDNPRILNDCALILIYHLERDLDLAEDLCARARTSGAEAYESSTEENARDEAFSAMTDALLNLARLRYDQQRLDECATTLDELLDLHPARPDALMLKVRLEARVRDASAE